MVARERSYVAYYYYKKMSTKKENKRIRRRTSYHKNDNKSHKFITKTTNYVNIYLYYNVFQIDCDDHTDCRINF